MACVLEWEDTANVKLADTDGSSDSDERDVVKELQVLAWRIACVGYGAPLTGAILLSMTVGLVGFGLRGAVIMTLVSLMCLVPVLARYVYVYDNLRRTQLATDGLMTRVKQLELTLRICLHTSLQGFQIVTQNQRTETKHDCNHEQQLKDSKLHQKKLEWDLKKEKENAKNLRRRLQKLQDQREADNTVQLLDKQKELLKKKERLDETVHVERKKASKLQSELQRERNSKQFLESQLEEEKERVRKLEEKVRQLISERDGLKVRQAKKDGSGECIVCMKNKRQLLFRPCNHFCVCNDCSDALCGKCPICRKPIQRTERIYA